ncbi:unnamed protein product [Ilex paraguariensis]|uniref:RNase H type-1 domain-containing protein n=1 Tax=Ilex paraguariensis TaxID=185542 RepID=A0ABC8R5F9_9AQUA
MRLGELRRAAKGSTGLSGGGMVIRNSEGHVLATAVAFYNRGICKRNAMLCWMMVLGKVAVPWKCKTVLD